MMELHELEELFKSVELVKSRAAVQALLRHAEMLHREDVTPEQKKIALAKIKKITQGAAPKEKKPKAQEPAGPVGKVKLKYSPAYQHYGVTQEHWNAAKPDAHKELFEHHNNVMAGKVPSAAHIKTAVEQAKAQGMKKNLDRLYNIFSELKKRI